MDKLLNLIGLAQKAGRLAVGEEPTGAAARARDARLILVAADAAENSVRRVRHFADAGQWGVDLLFDGVHFSEAGHWAFAEGLRLVLEDWEPGQFRKN